MPIALLIRIAIISSFTMLLNVLCRNPRNIDSSLIPISIANNAPVIGVALNTVGVTLFTTVMATIATITRNRLSVISLRLKKLSALNPTIMPVNNVDPMSRLKPISPLKARL